MNKYIMLLSTNRHVGLDLQAELDDARAEIEELIELNRRLNAENNDLTEQNKQLHASNTRIIQRYEKEIAYLKQVGRHLLDSIAAAHPEYALRPPPPPSSLNQQMAQTNPYAIAQNHAQC